jgi:protein-tyrosine phosphatase
MILQSAALTRRASIPAVSQASVNQPLSQPPLIPLEHGCNFRQISGQMSRDGRRVRAGKLYRSGVLAYFSAQDHQQLASVGIRTIVDLRRADERRREPTRWCSSDVTTLTANDESAPASLLRFALRPDQTPANMRQAMIDVYRGMPESLADQLRALFDRLLQGQVPLLIHCSAGKDRTGFASAVVLEALGVPRAAIVQDYLHTNEAVNLERFVLEHHPGVARHKDSIHPLKRTSQEVRDALLRAHEHYLDAALEALEQKYGTVENYLSQRLSIDAQQLATIRHTLLE